LGVWGGVVIGCLTPWIALNGWANAFCFYATIYYDWELNFSNCFWIFKRYKTTGMIVGLVLGAFLKYLFLSFAVRHLVEAPAPLVAMMSTPQLVTALIGGALAFIVIKTKILPEEILK